jgi:hypothetical protein
MHLIALTDISMLMLNLNKEKPHYPYKADLFLKSQLFMGFELNDVKAKSGTNDDDLQREADLLKMTS